MGIIDVSLISKAEARIIGWHWYEMLERFYSDPEIEAKFQEWSKEQDEIEKELKSGKEIKTDWEQPKSKTKKRNSKILGLVEQTA